MVFIVIYVTDVTLHVPVILRGFIHKGVANFFTTHDVSDGIGDIVAMFYKSTWPR
jgi:hypothetical protein